MCGQVRFGFGGVPFIWDVLNVWTIIFFVKDGESRIERIAGKGERHSSAAGAERPVTYDLAPELRSTAVPRPLERLVRRA
jgi:hypothetical protein